MAATLTDSEKAVLQSTLESLGVATQETAAATSTNFFQLLVQHLAQTFNAKCAFVAECTDAARTQVRTLAFWVNKAIGENVSYPLTGTPCEHVIAGEACVFPERIQSLFPLDKDLVTLEAEGYVGMPLRSATGHVLGHVAVLSDKPLHPQPQQMGILKILAARAGAELQRERTQRELERLSHEQAVLLDINRAINSHLHRDELFGALAQALKSLVPTERFGVELPIENGTKLQGHILSNIAQGLAPTQPTVLPAPGTACNFVLQTQQRYIASSSEDFRKKFPVTYSVMSGAGQESLLTLPLVTGGKSVAALFFMTSAKSAYDHLRSEFLDQIASAVAVALDNALAHERLRQHGVQLEAQNVYLQEEIKGSHNFEELIGSSTSLKKALKGVERVAPTDSTVLITGETGTGKELIARAIHNLSPRKDRALVKVNCAAIPAGLIESELFGHEKGAFTGALTRKMGRFEVADKGTIFLDEIGELPLDLQSKLLRVLQEGEFERVGGTQTFKVNVRVIAATNRNLEQLSKTGQYRPDLYYRLNVFPIHLPALREREGDIALLTQYFVHKFATNFGKKIDRIPERMVSALQRYQWPGNIRELEHVIERAVILSEGSELEPIDWLSPSTSKVGNGKALTLEEMERQHIVDMLEQTNWRVSGEKGAAKVLGLNPTTLEARMKKLGITRVKR